MMNRPNGFRSGDKFRLQAAAFLLIALPPIGLYFAIAAGITWAVWSLMGVIVAGMLLGILAS